MYRFLLQGKWVALTLLMVVVAPLSVVAADWQFNRWESRKSLNALVLANSSGAPEPIAALVAEGGAVEPSREWRQVTATGRYLQDQSLLVRRQVVNGRTGFIVVTPLATADGRVVVIERGWIAQGVSGSVVVPPAAPSGTVTVTGRLRPAVAGEGPVRPDDLPPQQVNWVDPLAIATAAALPGYDAIVEQIGATPPDSALLTPRPPPEMSEGSHLSYVGQWALIGLASIIIWVIVVRREAQHLRAKGEAGASTDGAPAASASG